MKLFLQFHFFQNFVTSRNFWYKDCGPIGIKTSGMPISTLLSRYLHEVRLQNGLDFSVCMQCDFSRVLHARKKNQSADFNYYEM